jgi:endoribonuclease Dicer
MVDYERLETLGDSFLKFAVSCSVYQKYLTANEGELSSRRVECISNARLCQIALDNGWEQLFFTRRFQPRKWCPNGTRVSQNDEEVHVVSRKTVADFVEALIGACYVDGGTNVALAFLSSKLDLISPGILPEEKDIHKMDSLSLNLITDRDRLNDVVDISRLEILLRYRFVNPHLPTQALTHYSRESRETYQRLEFLGDSVLDWLVTRFIYNSNPSSTPGDLSILRQAIVSNESLGLLSLKLNLFDFVLNKTPDLIKQVALFTSFVNERKARRHVDYTLKCPKVCWLILTRKILGDIFESIVGAVFVDSGWNIYTTWNVFKPLIIDFIEQCADPLAVVKSPIRLFLEIVDSFSRKSNSLTFM